MIYEHKEHNVIAIFYLRKKLERKRKRTQNGDGKTGKPIGEFTVKDWKNPPWTVPELLLSSILWHVGPERIDAEFEKNSHSLRLLSQW